MVKTRKKAASSDGDTGNGCGVGRYSIVVSPHKASKTASPLVGGRGYAAFDYSRNHGGRQEVSHDVSGKNLFETVKERVAMPEAAAFYGYAPNRAGFICCPFHAEKTPSCKIYEQSFYCFGCHTGGTVIDFTARLFDLKPLDAAKRLNDDFHLGLNLERHEPTKAERDAAEKRRKIKAVQQAFEIWLDKADKQFSACIFTANEALKRKTPEQWTKFEILAVKHQDELNYYADILLLDDFKAKFALFQTRKEIDALCGTILQA